MKLHLISISIFRELKFDSICFFNLRRIMVAKIPPPGMTTLGDVTIAVMAAVQPDIVVISPDGEYLMIVEVKLNDIFARNQETIDQLKYLMASTSCSVGLLICGERVVLLRDSFEQSNGESISIVGEAVLPDSLLPPADDQRQGNRYLEFELRVQRWLEKLQLVSNVKDLPDDLERLLGEPIIGLLRLGEVRAARPRWSKVAK
jgi:hypothetical protein